MIAWKKKQAADEFLVEKKNPLVEPPEYGELPTPTDTNLDETKTSENEIENLLNSEGTKSQSIELGNNSNKTRIYKLKEMDADHVTAWSKGGKTDASNCEMLCKTHNRAKGNR